MRELLRHRDFRLLLAGQTLSMFGDWTLLLVFGIWAKTLTGSNAIAGLTVLAMAAPGLIGPFAGVLVDRLPRRAVMVVLDVASAAMVCTLWFVDDRRQLWLLFAVALWYGFSGVMFNAAMSGLVQAMLPLEHVGQANGLLATVRQALRLIGPIVGAGLFTTVGGHWVATLDATTFLLSSAALLLLRHREAAATRQPVPFWTELGTGLRHLWTTPLLRTVAWTTVIFSLGIGAIEPTVYALVDGLDRPADFVGILVSVQGGGAILGGLGVSAAIRRVPEPKLVTVGLALVAAGIALCAIPAVPAALAGFVLIGAGLPTLTVAIATLLQRSTPSEMMGRVAAGYDTIGTVPTTASIALGAVLVGIWPYQLILGISAAGCALAALLMSVRSRAPRPLDPSPSPGESTSTPPVDVVAPAEGHGRSMFARPLDAAGPGEPSAPGEPARPTSPAVPDTEVVADQPAVRGPAEPESSASRG